jgi:hypothetical protein
MRPLRRPADRTKQRSQLDELANTAHAGAIVAALTSATTPVSLTG